MKLKQKEKNNSKFTKKDWYIFSGILLFGIILRIIYLWQFKGCDLFSNVSLDADFYNTFAKNIANTKDFIGKDVFFMNPGYPYFLAILYLVFNQAFMTVILSQFVIGIISCLLIFGITLKLFKKQTALIALFLSITFNMSIFYESLILSDTLINFSGLLILFILVYFKDKINYKSCFLAGIATGASVLFRPNILLFFVLVIGWLYFQIKDYKKLIICIISMCAGLFIIVFPVSLRNYIVAKQFVISTSSFGMNFYMGNHKNANGTYKQVKFARSDPRYEEHDFRREAEKLTRKELTASQSSQFWKNRTLKIITRAPVKWTGLLLKKFYYFFNGYEISSNYNFYFYKKFIPLLSILIISFSILAPLGIIGLILSRKRHKELSLLYLYFFTHFFTNMLFFVLSEYRYPGIPVLIIFSACTVSWLFNKMKRKNYSGLIFILILLSIYPKNIGAKFHNNRIAVEHYNLGCTYMLENKHDKSIKELSIAIKFIPDFGEAYNTLGIVYKNLKRYQDAINAFKTSIRFLPNFIDMHINLGDVYLLEGNLIGAFNSYQQGLNIEPKNEALKKRYQNVINKLMKYRKP